MKTTTANGLVPLDAARPGDLIGWRRDGRPIRLVGGGAEDDDGDDELDTGDEDDDGEGDGEDEDVDALKARITRMEAALHKANKQAARLRQQAKGRPATPGKGDDGDGAEEAAEEAAEAAAEAKLKRIAAVAALAGEGLSKAQAKLAARMLDLADVELDDDGDGDFDDAIEELREAFPALFKSDDEEDEPARPRRRPHAARLTTGDKGRQAGRKKQSATDRAVKALIG